MSRHWQGPAGATQGRAARHVSVTPSPGAAIAAAFNGGREPSPLPWIGSKMNPRGREHASAVCQSDGVFSGMPGRGGGGEVRPIVPQLLTRALLGLLVLVTVV
jgi:hypothetical protein